MVFENSDIREELFPILNGLRLNDPERSYKFTVAPDEITNDTIERMYGPFNSMSDDYSSTPVSSPRVNQKNEESNMMQRQQEINELKRLIAERQARKSPSGRTAGELSRIVYPVEAPLPRKIMPIVPLRKADDNPETSVTENPIDITVVKPAEEPVDKATDKPLVPIVVLDDSDEDMVVESDEDMLVESDENIGGAGNRNIGRVIDENTGSAIGDSPNSTFYTACESFMETEDNEVKSLEEKLKNTAIEIKRLAEERKRMYDLSREIKVKLLGIKVRMSLGKRREELRKRPQEAPPSLGKRKYNEANADEITQPHPQRTSRKRFEYSQPDMMNYNYTSPSAASFYQQLPAQPMLNYIGPPINYLPNHHLQSSLSSPSPLPPPPPPTELPPFTPPPPPPPPLASSQPFINRYPVQQATATSLRRTNPSSAIYKPPGSRNKNEQSSSEAFIDGSSFSNGTSINNDTATSNDKATSNDTAIIDDTDRLPMGNLDKIESTLKEMEQFIAVRIFSDLSSHPIIEGRPLPRPLRLITVDTYTMSMQMEVLDVVSFFFFTFFVCVSNLY